MRHTKIALASLGITLAALLAGCVVEPPPRRVVERPVVVEPAPGPVVYVQQPPPAPLTEALPSSPGPDFVWKPGHWRWDGHDYVWHHGEWERRERAGEWVPPHWEQRSNGWLFIEGHWR